MYLQMSRFDIAVWTSSKSEQGQQVSDRMWERERTNDIQLNWMKSNKRIIVKNRNKLILINEWCNPLIWKQVYKMSKNLTY